MPGAAAAARARSAAPRPPAAPAPGSSASPAGQPGRSRSSTPAKRASAASSSATSSRVAPFCGPKTARRAVQARSAGCPRRWRRPARRRAAAGAPPSPAQRGQRRAAVRQRVAGRVERRARRGRRAARRRRRWWPSRRARPRPRGRRPRPRRRPARPGRTRWCACGSRSAVGEQVQAAGLRRSPRTRSSPASRTVPRRPGGPSGSTVGTGDHARRRSAAASTSTKPGPPSAAAAATSSSPGAAARQPVGDRRGGLDRGQRAGELVRSRSARASAASLRSVTVTGGTAAAPARAVGPSDDAPTRPAVEPSSRPPPRCCCSAAAPTRPPSAASTAPATCPRPSDPDLVERAARRQGGARRPGLRARPPLPARRGHPVRRRDRRLVQAGPRGGGPARTPSSSSSAACTSWPRAPTSSPAPTQQVILPDLAAGCSMADMAALRPGRGGAGTCSTDARRRRRRPCR